MGWKSEGQSPVGQSMGRSSLYAIARSARWSIWTLCAQEYSTMRENNGWQHPRFDVDPFPCPGKSAPPEPTPDMLHASVLPAEWVKLARQQAMQRDQSSAQHNAFITGLQNGSASRQPKAQVRGFTTG
jgi:hypothetical protein